MEQHIELDGTYMNVIRFGSGKKNLSVIAGVSLCGLEGMGQQLEAGLSELSKDFTVYVFDRKKVLPKGYTMNQMAEDIYFCLKKMGVEKTSVFGASQGGMLGQILAESHPELVENLVLCSSTAKVRKDNEAFSKWKEASKKCDLLKLNSLFLEYVYSDSFKESIKDLIPTLLQQGTPEDCQRFTVLVESMEDFDITDNLEKIKCPVLVICDKNDKVFDYKRGLEIAEKLGCQSFLYDQYSHAVYDEAPDFKGKIVEFCR